MHNILLCLEYDGNNYHGWQRQKNVCTLQETIEGAIYSIIGEKCELFGCGRTDAKVHAVNYYANFKTNSNIDPFRLITALNSQLPTDISIKKAQYVDEDFHARSSAVRKQYQYKIVNRATREVFSRNYAWLCKPPLDLDKMREAAGFFVGEHDFSAFCSADTVIENRVRTIYSLEINKNNDIITIEVCGNGFLYNMVRIIVGTLMYVGTGKIQPDDICKILLSRDRTKAGMTAPSHGLYMKNVEYMR